MTRAFIVFFALTLAACDGSGLQLAGPFPPANRNPNNTIPLAGSGNYVYNQATGSYSRFSSDPGCFSKLGETEAGCGDGGSGVGGAGGAAAGAGGK